MKVSENIETEPEVLTFGANTQYHSVGSHSQFIPYMSTSSREAEFPYVRSHDQFLPEHISINFLKLKVKNDGLLLQVSEKLGFLNQSKLAKKNSNNNTIIKRRRRKLNIRRWQKLVGRRCSPLLFRACRICPSNSLFYFILFF